jgi:SNF2 family DNA or RNA helicase
MNSELEAIIIKLGLSDLLKLSQDKAVDELSTKYRRKLAINKISINKFKNSKVTIEAPPASNSLTHTLPTNLPYKPFKHQIDAFDFYHERENKRLIIADEMGLGKTFTALMIAKSECLKVVVICPASLKMVWVRESEKFGIACEIFSYEKCPTRFDSDYFLIVDEAHYCQNPKSQRTNKVYQLSLHAYAVLLLTGTPMRNGKPHNLFAILKIIEHPITNNKYEFEKRYCDAKKTHFSAWDVSGASNLPELKAKISNALIQRKKDDCLDLPPKIYSDIYITPEKKDMINYFEMLDDMNDDNPLVELTRIRVFNSHIKIPFILKYLENFDDSLVIFSPFKTTVTLLADKLGVTPFTGDTSLDERNKIIEKFQKGESKIFIGTIGSGGVGVTLHTANHLIIIDPPLTPGDYHQACDRIHRIGQSRVCNIYNLRCLHIDNYVYDMISNKDSVIESSIPKILTGLKNAR